TSSVAGHQRQQTFQGWYHNAVACFAALVTSAALRNILSKSHGHPTPQPCPAAGHARPASCAGSGGGAGSPAACSVPGCPAATTNTLTNAA
ncbi:hypothetical protein HaLaN_23335, partial [Haematococcus lacustris]